MTRILLYGDKSFKDEVNLEILNATLYFDLYAKTLDEPPYLNSFDSIAATLQFIKF